MVTYKDKLIECMQNLSQDPLVRFLGYNVLYGSKAYGTLVNIDSSKCIETPLAENLMLDLAMGLALEGFKPVVFFERHDFLPNALDAIVNHLDKFKRLSHSQYDLSILIRAVVGSTKPLDPGIQHKQDFTDALKLMLSNTPVYVLNSVDDVVEAYKKVSQFNGSAIIVEKRDLYSISE